MDESSGVGDVGEGTAGLGTETEVEGQIEENADEEQAQEKDADFFPKTGIPWCSLEAATERVGQGEKEDVDGEIPGIQKAHGSHQQSGQGQSPAIEPEGSLDGGPDA